ANISHDLRTPLTLIEGYAEAMRDLPGENKPENMQVIIDETRRLTSLVNAVLEYSAGKSGNQSIEPCEFNLTASIRSILGRYQKLTALDGYHVRFDFSQSVTVFADEMRIGQVVYNLINNALTYAGEDKTVVVSLRVTDGIARVEVTDTGEGIAEEELPYIFSRYYRGQKPHKRAAVGTGLGLSIVKGILDAHGLKYGVNSRLGVGTTFWFALPAVNVKDEANDFLPGDADD
ncbi:MAG: HAMP domain-containing sensor histidine kinase, partial [Eubacteriales bacterium]|nr:HAMP domain-containing sensor histidine kinase [Eubacteriales bacterium]